jgi:hypothetical protein
MDQVTQYGKVYRDAIIEFKIRHFEDRSKVMLDSIRCMLHVWLILFDYDCWQIVSILLFHLLSRILFNTRIDRKGSLLPKQNYVSGYVNWLL